MAVYTGSCMAQRHYGGPYTDWLYTSPGIKSGFKKSMWGFFTLHGSKGVGVHECRGLHGDRHACDLN